MEARKSFLLRIDARLWRELERWAADDLRSVNGQVEWILREAVRRRRGAPSPERSEPGVKPGEDDGSGGALGS